MPDMKTLQEKVEDAIRETLVDPEGAGSDLFTAESGPGEEWMFIEGNLDVVHLASIMIDVVKENL